MSSVRLKVIPEPEVGTRTVIVPSIPDGTPVIGESETPNLSCGSCGAVLVTRTTGYSLQNIVFLCRCGAYNAT